VEAFDPTGKSVGIVFETTSPFETPDRMRDLLQWINQVIDQKSLHPLITIGIFVVVFLAIHPFQDGNGRLSRALTNLLLLRAGYLYVPFVSLENVVEQNKESYYLALRRTQKTLSSPQSDWSHWLLFFFRALLKQKRKLEKKLDQEKLLRSKLPELAQKILALALERGRVSNLEVVRLTQAHRNTVKKCLGSLVKTGFLIRSGKGRSTWYSLK
jgi:Fic family protein